MLVQQEDFTLRGFSFAHKRGILHLYPSHKKLNSSLRRKNQFIFFFLFYRKMYWTKGISVYTLWKKLPTTLWKLILCGIVDHIKSLDEPVLIKDLIAYWSASTSLHYIIPQFDDGWYWMHVDTSTPTQIIDPVLEGKLKARVDAQMIQTMCFGLWPLAV